MELIGIKVLSSWHTDNTWGSVVGIVEEHLGVLVGLEHSLTTGAASISLEDGHQVGSVHIFALVLDVASIVDVESLGTRLGWLIEKLAWEWVLGMVGDIIVCHHDDLVLWDTVLLNQLVCMAGVSLMSVVLIAIRSGNDHSPVVRVRSLSGNSAESEVLLVHFVIK